jgi:uncharacterized DUF497 family protein
MYVRQDKQDNKHEIPTQDLKRQNETHSSQCHQDVRMQLTNNRTKAIGETRTKRVHTIGTRTKGTLTRTEEIRT